MQLPALVTVSGPEFPDAIEYLWRWFQEISLGLPVSGFGPPVVTWEALRAWQDLAGVGRIEPWEARALVQLGMLRAAILAEKSNAENRQQQQARASPSIASIPHRTLPPPPSIRRR